MKKFPLEAFIWIAALLTAALFPLEEAHFTVCPLSLTGLDFCPGCGLGKSISLLFHGQFSRSLQAHPLGFFAVGVLTYRILVLLKSNLSIYGKNY